MFFFWCFCPCVMHPADGWVSNQLIFLAWLVGNTFFLFGGSQLCPKWVWPMGWEPAQIFPLFWLLPNTSSQVTFWPPQKKISRLLNQLYKGILPCEHLGQFGHQLSIQLFAKCQFSASNSLHLRIQDVQLGTCWWYTINIRLGMVGGAVELCLLCFFEQTVEILFALHRISSQRFWEKGIQSKEPQQVVYVLRVLLFKYAELGNFQFEGWMVISIFNHFPSLVGGK